MNSEKSLKLAKRIRINALKMTNSGKSSHIGSVFSCADILAVLYSEVLNFDCKNPNLETRDRFIVSKGHAGAGIYSVLAEVGFFDFNLLKSHYQNGSNLSGHVSHLGVPGVEFSTGALGHGLPISCGIAKAAMIKKQNFKVYTLLGDGECDEGSNWEAALFAAHHKLNNLIAIIDYNNLQSIKTVQETLNLEPFAEKWKSFGWNVIELNGNSCLELISGFDSLKKFKEKKPTCIIAHTVKGKGVSFMENNVLWHYRSPQGDEFQKAMIELNALI